MATYFVASGGSNTAPYDTWAKAATSLQTALTAASTPGDVVVLQYNAVPTGDAEVTATTTYTFAATGVSLICASNDGGSSYTPTAMGAANWVGNSTAAYTVDLSAPDRRVYVYGLTMRTAGNSTVNIRLLGDAAHYDLESCYLWSGSTNSSCQVQISAADLNTFAKFKDCTFRFGHTGHSIRLGGRTEIHGGSISSDGSAITTVFLPPNGADQNVVDTYVVGFDMSAASSTANLMGVGILTPSALRLIQCKVPASFVALATQTNVNRSSAEVWMHDCASGDTHGLFGYYNPLGSCISDSTIYYTSGAAAQSWKIVTTASASYFTPFESPAIDMYHSGTSAITPYLEILRDGSATAYQNDEVYARFLAKVTAGSVVPTEYSDRCTLANKLAGTTADQAAGAGVGSWTGENATAWSGKIDSGSALTPAEVGHIRAHVVVGEPSITVYVDPQIRT